LEFRKNANFFAENCRKSQKIVIITSTPDGNVYLFLSLSSSKRTKLTQISIITLAPGFILESQTIVTCRVGLLNLDVVCAGAVSGHGEVDGDEVEHEEVAVWPDQLPPTVQVRSVLKNPFATITAKLSN
jgi:hypothetical protein